MRALNPSDIVSRLAQIIVFYEGGGKPVAGLVSRQSGRLAVFVGPEGGFEPSEIEALAVIMSLTGNLD